MAARTKASRVGSGAFAAGEAARSNPYLRRLVEDAELRGNLRTAFESARRAYARMSNGKGPTRAIMDDKKVQRELKEAASSLRDAADSLRSARVRRKRRRGRALVVVLIGAGLALALSEGLRTKVLDALFGAEEEFEYTSTTTPEPAGEPVGTS